MSKTLNPTCNSDNIKTNFATNSNIPQQLCVPTLAYDQFSITLAWNKPDNYKDVVDYNVYMDGEKLGNASANAATYSPAQPYIQQFYKEDKAAFHTKITYHNFKVTGLKSNSHYHFTVRSITKNGKESKDSKAIKAKTATKFNKVVDVFKVGAVGDGKTLNTDIIQKAIDDCSNGSRSAYDCHVLIPANSTTGSVFLTGALFLKSNMTLEIAEGATLQGSTNSSDYPISQGYQIYSYYTSPTDDRRPPSLLNVLSDNHRNGPKALTDHHGYDEARGIFVNIRITGLGTLDGKGWLKNSTDLVDEIEKVVPQFSPGKANTVSTLGVLAKNQIDAAQEEVGGTFSGSQLADFYANRRSSLTTFRGVTNIYFGQLQITNPAFHGVMFVECENVVFANTVTQTFDINNADGVEFGNSDNALVFNNVINSGDDCINFAAGQGKDYENDKAQQQNAWIFNNFIREGHGAVVVGSHTSSFIQDVLAEDNVAFLTDNGLRLKSTPATGGGGRRISFRDNAMREIGTKNKVIAGGQTFTNNALGSPFVLTLAYSAGSNYFKNAATCAHFKNIAVESVSVDNGNSSTGNGMIVVDGYDGSDSSLDYPETFQVNLTMTSVKITNAPPTNISRLKDSTFTDVTITKWGLATSPWYISNSTGLSFVNVSPQPPKQSYIK